MDEETFRWERNRWHEIEGRDGIDEMREQD